MQALEVTQELTLDSHRTEPIVVGLLGCGVVGSALAESLTKDPSDLETIFGCQVTLKSVAVLHPDKPRPVHLPPGVLTGDAAAVVADPDIDVVIEAIGGVETPLPLVVEALDRGKDVITANKDLIANHGDRLRELAARRDAHLRYEAAVGGAVPALNVITQSLRGTAIEAISGVLNGTCNYILTKMESDGIELAEALSNAQELGYAESDPSFDIDGLDAVHKLVILIEAAFSVTVDPSEIHAVGIRDVAKVDLDAARAFSRRLRLVADVENYGPYPRCYVEPVAVPEFHVLARLVDCENAVVLETEGAGDIVLTGPGAGGAPTASSILGDLTAAIHCLPTIKSATKGRVPMLSPLPATHLVRVTLPKPDAVELVRGAFFGHGIALEDVKIVSTDSIGVITDACSQADLELVKECLLNRGATSVAAYRAGL